MTLPDTLAFFRRNNPEFAGLDDEQLLFRVGSAMEQAGALGDFPEIDRALRIRKAEAAAANQGNFGNAVDALQRGFARSAQGVNVLQGADDPTNAADIARYQRTVDNNPVSPEFREFAQADGFLDSAKAFVKAPVRIITEVMAESLGQSIPSAIGGFAGGAAAGANPVSAGIGAAVGAGSGSFITEYAGGILESLQEAGMDISRPESIQQFFSDPARVAAAKERATAKAIPVAVFDGVSMGLAGKFVRGLARGASLSQIARATGKELGLQSGAGMAGETLGQVAQGGDLDGKSIFLEGIAEVGSAPTEIASNILNTRRPAAATEAPAPTPTQRVIEQANAARRASLDVTLPVPPAAAAVPVAQPQQVATPTPQPVEVDTGPVLASPQTQALLIEVLSLSPEQAATIPEAEAQVLIEREVARQEAERIDAEASMQEAARQQAEAEQIALQEQAAARRRAEIAAQAAFAREEEARRRELLRGTRVGGQATLPGVREAAAVRGNPVIRPVDNTPDQPVLSPESPGQTSLNFTAPRPVRRQQEFTPGQVLTGGEQQTNAAAATPDLARSVPAPRVGTESGQKGQSAAPTPQVAAPTPQVAAPTPQVARSPIPLIRAAARSVLPSAQAARDTSKTDRLMVFRRGTDIEVRKVNSNGSLAARTNPGATIRSVLAALQERGVKASMGTVANALKGRPGVKNAEAILAEARAQGLTDAGKPFVTQSQLEKDNPGIEWIETLILPKGYTGPALLRMTADEYAAFRDQSVAEGQRLGQYDETAATAQQAPTAREADPEVLERTADTAPTPAEIVEQSEQVETAPQVESTFSAPATTIESTAPAQPEPLPATRTRAPARDLADQFSPQQLRSIHKALKEQGIEALSDDTKVGDDVRDFGTAVAASLPPEQVRTLSSEQLVALLTATARRLAKSEAVMSREQPIDVTESEVTQAFERAVRHANLYGVTVVQTEANKAIKGGTFEPGTRTIRIAMANVARPTEQDLITLLHEVAHDITEGAPEGVREALQRAARDILDSRADPRTRPGGGTELTPEQRATERVVERLALEGLDRTVSENWAAQLWRAAIDILTRAAVYLQRTILGEANVSGSLAATWAQNRMNQFLAGDKPISFLEQFGIPVSLGERVKLIHAGKDQVSVTRYNPRTGDIEYERTYNLDQAHENIGLAVESVKQSAINSGAWYRDRDLKYLEEELGSDLLRREMPDQNSAEIIANVAVQKAISEAKIAIAASRPFESILNQILEIVRPTQADLTPAQRRALTRDGTPAAAAIETFDDLLRALKISDPREAREKTLTKVRSTLETEFGEKVEGDIVNPNTSMADLAEGAELDAADKMAYQTAKAARNKLHAREKALRDRKLEIEERAPRNVAFVRAVNENLTDQRISIREATLALRQNLREIAKDFGKISDIENKLGQAAATVQALESEIDRRALSSRYTEKLLEKVNVGELPIASMLKALYELENAGRFELTSSPVTAVRQAIIDEVAANPDSSLAGLLRIGSGENASVRGTALLSSILTFVKRDGLMSDVLRAQLLKSEENTAALLELRKVYDEKSDQVLDQLTEDLKRTRPVYSNRLVQKFLNTRDKALKEQAELALIDRDLSAIAVAKGAFDDIARRAEANLKIGDNFEFIDGRKYLNPTTPEDSEEQLTANLGTLQLAGPNAFTEAQLRDILERGRAWVAAREDDPNQHGRLYNSLVDQNRKIARAIYGDEVSRMMTGLANGRLAGMTALAERSGTRSGTILATRLNRMVAGQRGYGARDNAMGNRFEAKEEVFLKATGIDVETFNELFYYPADEYLQTAQVSDRVAFVELDRMFRADPITAEYWAKPGAAEAFYALQREVVEQINYQNQKMAEQYADRVSDEGLVDRNVFTGAEGASLRRQIQTGVAGYTRPRTFSSDLTSWASGFDYAFAVGDARENPFRDTKLKLEQGGLDALAPGFARLFDEVGWRVFLEPLLMNKLGGVPQPDRPDGVDTHIPTSDVFELLRGNDLPAFMREAFRRYGDGTPEGEIAYYEKFTKWLNKTWREVDSAVVPSRSPKTGAARMGGIPALGLDARAKQTWPGEWFRAQKFGPSDHTAATHTIVANGVFGRNMSELSGNVDSLEQELAAMRRGMPRTDKEWAALKQSDPARYKKLREVDAYVPPDWDNIITDVFNTERSFISENRTFMEAFSGLVTGLTSGIRTALKNPVSLGNFMLIEKSISSEALGDVASAYGKAGKLFLGAVAEAFGFRPFSEHEQIGALNREGYFDAATRVRISDLYQGERGVNDNLGKTARVLRRMRNVFQQARLGASLNGQLPALRLLNPFQFTQVLVNFASNWQMLDIYEKLAKKGAEFYANGGDTTRPLTAKDLGLKDAVRFKSLRGLLMENGLTLEDLARKKQRGQSIYDADLLRAVNNVTLDKIANEASIANRPVILSRSKLGQISGTFVGWGFAQATRARSVFRDQENQTNLSTLARGAWIMGLGMVPMTLAYSMALDEWDELIGKKSNKRPASLDPRAMLEAMVDVGTVGMLGDTVDYVVNTAQGTSGRGDMLSVDSRIVLLNTVRNFARLARNTVASDFNVTWDTTGRQLMQTLGGGGILQNAYVFDKLFLPGTVLDTENAYAIRSNAQNYLRAAGREIELEVRAFGGGDYTPNAVTPYATQMILAAFRNDRNAFQKAYEKAVEAAREDLEQPDPYKYVQQAFAARHPLVSPFKNRPSYAEVQKMLSVMPEEGRRAAQEAIRLVNTYGAAIGVTPFVGSTSLSPVQMQRATRRPEPGVLDRLRASLARGE